MMHLNRLFAKMLENIPKVFVCFSGSKIILIYKKDSYLYYVNIMIIKLTDVFRVPNMC